MRRHLQPTPAPVVHLSAEEQAIIADEVNQHSLELTDTVAESERLGDIIISMGDVQTVVSNEPQIGQVEETLISAVADMAVAGTDANAEEVVQDLLPSAQGLSAESAVEGIRAALLRVWNAIKTMLEKMWGHIERFFTRIGDFFTGTKRRIEKLEALLGTTPRDHITDPKDDVEFKGQPELLLVDGKPTSNIGKSYGDLVTRLDQAMSAAVDQGKHVIKAGGDLYGAMVKDADKVQRNVGTYLQPLYSGLVGFKQHLKLGDGTKEDANTRISTDDLLGDFRFICTFPINTYEENIGHDLLQLAGIKLQLANVQKAEGAKVKLTHDFKTIETALSNAKHWVGVVEKKAKEIGEISGFTKQVREHLDSQVKQAAEKGEKAEGDVKAHLKAILNVNGRIQSQVARLLHAITDRGTQITNTVLDYGIQSCEHYSKKPEAKAA
jgi:hypothetical protein